MEPSPKSVSMIVKTCGLRQPDNITAVAELPVDWIGLIFYAKSPRYVGEEEELIPFLREKISEARQPKRVGVFVNETFDNIQQAIKEYGLDFVQLHGGESAVYCASLKKMIADEINRPVGVIRAFRVSRAFDFAVTFDYEGHCDYFIFDTKAPQVYGGTGHKFDWEILNRYQGQVPFLLSGGIGPEDAAEIRELSHPALAGVDLNSRFELEPGLKNVTSLKGFVNQIKDKK